MFQIFYLLVCVQQNQTTCNSDKSIEIFFMGNLFIVLCYFKFVQCNLFIYRYFKFKPEIINFKGNNIQTLCVHKYIWYDYQYLKGELYKRTHVWIYFRRYLRETLKMANSEDLNRLTSCSLVLLGHIFLSLGNNAVSTNRIIQCISLHFCKLNIKINGCRISVKFLTKTTYRIWIFIITKQLLR